MRDVFKNEAHSCKMENHSETVNNNFDSEFAGNRITQEDELNEICEAIASVSLDDISLDADGDDNSKFHINFRKILF